MQNEPQFPESSSDRLFQVLQTKWIGLLVLIIASFVYLMLTVDVSREPELPNRPLTKADLPLLKKKVKFLKSDAENLSKLYRHLNNPDESRAANRAWEELYYTPEIFPSAAELRRVQNARLLELRPDLAGHVQAKQAYEEGRYEIANNPAIADKAAAILKRHPELAGYCQELTYRNEACHHLLSQANALERQIAALENGMEPARTTAPKLEAPAAKNFNAPTNPPTTAAAAPPAPLPEVAIQYGVTVGDTVDISALKPAIALRLAKLTAMDNDQLTVCVGEDVFTVRWQNVIHLKKTDAGKAR